MSCLQLIVNLVAFVTGLCGTWLYLEWKERRKK